jgi:hypothetical protein
VMASFNEIDGIPATEINGWWPMYQKTMGF